MYQLAWKILYLKSSKVFSADVRRNEMEICWAFMLKPFAFAEEREGDLT